MKNINEFPCMAYALMYGLTVVISLVWVYLIDKQKNNLDDKSNEGKSES